MNIRDAILAAADKIESEPRRFNFDSICIPGITCGSPGCALGWIAAFHGDIGDTYSRSWNSSRMAGLLGLGSGGDNAFYSRMDRLEEEHFGIDRHDKHEWMWTARRCAAVMRIYADRYHPAPKLGIPASVRAIFDAPANVPMLEGDSRA